MESICFAYIAWRPRILILTDSLRLISIFFSKCSYERRIQHLSIIHMFATITSTRLVLIPTCAEVIAILNMQGEKCEEH